MAKQLVRFCILLGCSSTCACASDDERPAFAPSVRQRPDGLIGLTTRASAGGGTRGPEPALEEDTSLGAIALNELDVTGYLEGSLRDIVLQHETTQNLGFATSWDRAGFLDLAVAAETRSGVGMLLLTLEGGDAHPLLTNGSWSYADEMSNAVVDVTTSTFVGSCAGPDLGFYPFEDPPIDYELHVEPSSEPERITIGVNAHFENDGYLDGRIELSRP